MRGTTRHWKRVGAAASGGLWIAIFVGGPAAAGFWAINAPALDRQPAPVHGEAPREVDTRSKSRDRSALDPRIFSVTLVDDLFPPTPEPPPLPPKPKLNLQLIAITQSGAEWSIFVKDLASWAYFDMAIGDRTSTGAELISIDEVGAAFELPSSQQSESIEVRLELEP